MGRCRVSSRAPRARWENVVGTNATRAPDERTSSCCRQRHGEMGERRRVTGDGGADGKASSSCGRRQGETRECGRVAGLRHRTPRAIPPATVRPRRSQAPASFGRSVPKVRVDRIEAAVTLCRGHERRTIPGDGRRSHDLDPRRDPVDVTRFDSERSCRAEK